MLYYSAALLVGFLVLFKSADQFVISSVTVAKNLDISPTIIGLTVVALGTSAPEIFVSITSSLQGEPSLAVGNAIGSNIANIGLVLGFTALIVPLKFRVDILRNDLPILVFVTLCAGASLIDLHLGPWDGILLLAGLALFVFRLTVEQRQSSNLIIAAELSDLEELPPMPTRRAVITFVVSLVLLLLSAELLVWSVVHIAKALNVSELLIGLTVIAIGTSLPELVVSVTSALKNQTDLAVGNIVGSNILNILAVLSLPGLIHPSSFDPSVLWRDYALMLFMTAMLILFAYGFRQRSGIGRPEGALLLAVWVLYLYYLYLVAIG